jgi:SAM-dependent methyltransferase
MATRQNKWTKKNVRHVAAFFRQGRNPAARVYESIGSDFFLAPSQGWLNLGLWEGSGSEWEAEAACRRLVETVAAALPKGGVVLDVGNGLGAQDPVISAVARARTLVALNITEWQLRAGRARLRAADASPVVGDACRLPIAGRSLDGVISVEAAFHFASRRAFFEECVRVLRPGGVLTMSDIATQRSAARAVGGDGRCDPAQGVGYEPRRGDARSEDRSGRPRSRPGRRGGLGMRRPSG